MQHSIGVIGLGVMGRNLALNMASHQEEVAIYNYTRDLTDDLVAHDEGLPLHPYYDIEAFVQSLARPRKIFMMVTAGSAIDSVIESLLPHLETGDIIMDGGNSHFLDTERRFDELQRHGIEYIGVGV
ncbi:MAG TPA: phosphogluconate dehydrogenase (NADP(+)-dependent, decarboxylating), partial [Exiguobacterium sp.]|nr:phosphogluconate dehydrogenase (NADP(+)-dependent, decarboxylating) [Exiguobacterium sp.]HBQ77566.1 phosphogluconate dehydrogenase (NADP(+)-dependent, decarboxylating) [Exiguobacterium sp.]